VPYHWWQPKVKISRRLETYDEVNKVEFFLMTSVTIYDDWLKNEVDKRIVGQMYLLSLLSSSAAATEDT